MTGADSADSAAMLYNPGMKQVTETEMLGTKRITDGASQSIKDVVTFQCFPDIPVPETMFRMCPLFIQPRDDARVVSAETTTDAASELPYNYGSLTYVAEWSTTSFRKLQYRIYTRIVAIVPDTGGASDLARPVPLTDVVLPIGGGALDAERLRFEMSPDFFYSKVDHGHRMAFVLNNQPIVGTVTGLNIEPVARHFVQLTFDDAAAAAAAHGYLASPAVQVYWINNPEPDAAAIGAAIDQLNTQIDTLPVVLFGMVSRYEDVIQMGRTITLSVMMMGRAYLIVQPTFFDTLWIAGEDIYAVLTEQDAESESTRLFSIEYVHKADVPDTGVAVVYIGMYLGPSDHAYYKCCTVTLPPCVEEPVRILP